MDFKKDYYKILEVSATASKEDIKASYRRLAKIYHPDKNPGDPEAEEKIKLINEANDILSNEILRHEYDAYLKEEEQWKKDHQKTRSAPAGSANKRHYQQKKTIIKETRIYIRGEVRIKYWANTEADFFASFDKEVKYKITPTQATVNIAETDIHPLQGIPVDYLKAFKESELFKTPIPNPVQCIIKAGDTQEIYDLEFKDIRIKNIRLEGITKHEKQSFGMLVGDIYAYTPKFETFEEFVEVEECFGETGQFEKETKEGATYFRKEYYHPDCSTYWGEWYTVKETASTGVKTNGPVPVAAEGCAQWWWIPVLLLFIILFPKMLLLFLILTGIGLLFSLGAKIETLIGRILPILGFGLLLLFVISAIRSISGGRKYIVRHDKPKYDTLSTVKRTVKRTPENGDTSQAKTDSLISHYIRWKDYEETQFETTLSVTIPDVMSSVVDHNKIDPFFNSNSLAPAYVELLRNDNDKLNYVYSAFDSVRIAYNLDDLAFSKMMVSCIQSIPYFLVVDQSCTADYDDDFTKNYLANCNSDCCIGFEKFGVRSPAEFLSDLKGDCDTRALFLYQVLKHYNYNVALITSQYYKHAMIAVNYPENLEPVGLSMSIHNKNYYLWETTSSGLNVGIIPDQLQNLNFWDIALLNEK